MEEFLNYDYRKIFQTIRGLKPILQYAACAKFFDLIRPYFCCCNLNAENKLFFRVRSHPHPSKDFYFYNNSDLSFRTDFFNINSYGRCNGPFESIFYCSDHPMISFLEVTNLSKKENRSKSNYYTTGIWQAKQSLSLTPILENQRRSFRNDQLTKITNNYLKTIDNLPNYSKKEELKEFHRIIGREFTKDFSSDQNVYLLSAAISNYLLNSSNNQRIKIEGLLYPTCIKHGAVREIGLNYAFDPCVIGYIKK